MNRTFFLKTLKKIKFTLGIFCLLETVNAQSPMPQATDSIQVEKLKPAQADSMSAIHSPRKATLLSTALPGLGQVYNKKYWKIPIIYGIAGAMTYFIIDNNTQYQQYKNAFSIRLDGDPTTIDKYVNTYSDEDLRLLKNYYRRNRDLSYIALGMTYLLNIVDAAVDAHLYYFDISDDISLKIQPCVNPIPQNYFAGLNLRFMLK
jgi:hypothetical protein